MSSPGPSGPHGRRPSLLERARDDQARGADGDLPLVLAREALLRSVGKGVLGALTAMRRALQRDVRELAAEVALWVVGAAKFRVEARCGVGSVHSRRARARRYRLRVCLLR